MREPQTVGIALRVEISPEGIRAACEYLVGRNLAYLARHPETPTLMKSGVRYAREPRGSERWQTIPEVLEFMRGDCEDLASWLTAELRARGIPAEPFPISRNGQMWHVVVKLPDGRTFDPSKALGMP